MTPEKNWQSVLRNGIVAPDRRFGRGRVLSVDRGAAGWRLGVAIAGSGGSYVVDDMVLPTGDRSGHPPVVVGAFVQFLADPAGLIEELSVLSLPGGAAGEPGLVARKHELLASASAFDAVMSRASAAAAARQVLAAHQFVELDSPLLQLNPLPEAPFPVQVQNSPAPGHLRSDPAFLRALVGAGVDRVYEFARNFRDEPTDQTHVLEYTLIEIAWASADYYDMAGLAREVLVAAASNWLPQHPNAGQIVAAICDEWQVLSFHSALSAGIGAEVTPATGLAELAALARRRGWGCPSAKTADELASMLYDRYVQYELSVVTLVHDFPASLAEAAEPCADPRLSQKWDLVVRGIEIATSYTELVDPVRIRDLAQRRPNGEAASFRGPVMRLIEDGLPAFAGMAIGLERLAQVLCDADSISSVIPFGTMHTLEA